MLGRSFLRKRGGLFLSLCVAIKRNGTCERRTVIHAERFDTLSHPLLTHSTFETGLIPDHLSVANWARHKVICSCQKTPAGSKTSQLDLLGKTITRNCPSKAGSWSPIP
jgi:hypothetical protein